ncbi:Fic family protein [Candidatus Margulisiibacteriota bacterium]
MLFKLEKPDLTKISKKQILKLFADNKKAEIFNFLKRIDSDHLYWDKFYYKEPSPKEITKEELWMITKILRESKAIKTIITDKFRNAFTWSKLDYFEKFFHKLDMNMGGELFIEIDKLNKLNKQKMITRGIMEEAIASSQLEGAASSRLAAKKMLREGKKPTNRSEQMILNNFISMKAIEDDYKDRTLSMDMLFELHALITQDTTDSEDEKPHLRKTGEPVFVSDESTGVVYFEAPEIDFVKKELTRLINFANDESGTRVFIHPIIKAIMIHFWIGYLHPFSDGNGRLARLLFYWYLIKKGYWAFVYLPISKIIKRSPKQYIMAYVYSEQDDNDLTYFINYNLNKIKLAAREFEEYLAKQSDKNVQMKKRSEAKYALNIRQVQLLQYLHNAPDERTTQKTHMNINQISKMTASNDLKDLLVKGFLSSVKQGRNVFYYGTDKIKDLF